MKRQNTSTRQEQNGTNEETRERRNERRSRNAAKLQTRMLWPCRKPCYADPRSMRAVIAIANQKGGVGKTTSAAALAVAFSRLGRRVHVIDFDPQADLTRTFGQREAEGSLFKALKERTALPVVELTENLSLTPSSVHLRKGESEFVAEPGREHILKESLERTDLPDDTLVIIDCPPSLGVLSVNALTAAGQVVVALHPGGYEVEALVNLKNTLGVVQQRVNPQLEVAGVILTNCDMRKRITRLVRGKIGRAYELLGLIRQEAGLQYAAGEGTLLNLQSSQALEEYKEAARLLDRKLLWQKETSAA